MAELDKLNWGLPWAVQGLGLQVFTAKGAILIPHRGTKITQATSMAKLKNNNRGTGLVVTREC